MEGGSLLSLATVALPAVLLVAVCIVTYRRWRDRRRDGGA